LPSRRCVVDRIVKQIENGPGELDIIFDIRRVTHVHPYFTFNKVRVPVHITNFGEPVDPKGEHDEPGADKDWVALRGVVLLHERNRHQYHGFAAMYNLRTRKGTAEFEPKCCKCGSDLNEYGVCPKCDPCPRCDQRGCNGSCIERCMYGLFGNNPCKNNATWKGVNSTLVVCDECKSKCNGEFVAL
jgi:hypothetical protein